MRYQGGKARLGKRIAEVILSYRDPERHTRYVEPFVGGTGVLTHMARQFEDVQASDALQDITLMWDAVVNDGWVPPTDVGEDLYGQLREDDVSSALRGFVGTACSFGGKWFGGYARDKQNNNYAATGSRAITKQAQRMSNVTFTHADYRDVQVDATDIVYCDPPYANTTSYTATPNFDTQTFWSWCDEAVEAHEATVFVSEFNAPDHWNSVWSDDRQVMLKVRGKGPHVVEHLFMHESQATGA